MTVPQGSRGIMVRIMEGGGRTNYYRVSIPGKETFTITGEVSTDPTLTHIPISSNRYRIFRGSANEAKSA